MEHWNDNQSQEKRKSGTRARQYHSSAGHAGFRTIACVGIGLALAVALILGQAGTNESAPSSQRAASSRSASCKVYSSSDRGEFDITLIVAGDEQESAWVDIYKYNSSTPEDVLKRYRKTFSDTGEPYILQSYSTYSWEPGTYVVEWTLKGKSGKKRLVLKDADQRIDVVCD